MASRQNIRTDLAMENPALEKPNLPGIESFVEEVEDVKITTIHIKNKDGEKILSKPQGKYITLEIDAIKGFSDHLKTETEVFSKQLQSLLPPQGLVLVVGLGNADVTPDAVGPQTVDGLLATRHLSKSKDVGGLENLRPVAAVAPGVLGQTGVETAEITQALCKKINPAAVVVVDALAAREVRRLGNTIQISNTGIEPGSGVQNSRKELSAATLGIPVIAIGVPTVVDMGTIVYDLTEGKTQKAIYQAEQMMVTPREIDRMIAKSAKILSLGINCALQPLLSYDDILSLTDLC